LEAIPDLEDVVLLVLAADEFLLDPLVKLCCLEIESRLTTGNVWPILNKTLHIPQVTAVLKKVHIKLFPKIFFYIFLKQFAVSFVCNQ